VWGYRENDPLGGHDPYSASKGCAELVFAAYARSFFTPGRVRKHGLGLASVRAGNVLGASEEFGSEESLYGTLDAGETADLTVAHKNVGLTGVTWAVAETGSLVVAPSSTSGRMLSLAPLVHVALVRRDQIVADLLDLFAPSGIGRGGMPSGAVLITTSPIRGIAGGL
jgi:hypothetical protein